MKEEIINGEKVIVTTIDDIKDGGITLSQTLRSTKLEKAVQEVTKEKLFYEIHRVPYSSSYALVQVDPSNGYPSKDNTLVENFEVYSEAEADSVFKKFKNKMRIKNKSKLYMVFKNNSEDSYSYRLGMANNEPSENPDDELLYSFEAESFKQAIKIYDNYLDTYVGNSVTYKRIVDSNIRMLNLLEFESPKEKMNFKADILNIKIVNTIIQAMEEKGITKKELAKAIGTSKGYLTRVFSSDVHFTIHLMSRIEEALGINFKIFYLDI